MSDLSIECWRIDAQPDALVLPKETIVDVVATPEIKTDGALPAPWMAGYLHWQQQDIPLMCFEQLIDAEFERPDIPPKALVLSPIPKAARQGHSAILFFGNVQSIEIGNTIEDVAIPAAFDRRYGEAAFEMEGQTLVVPKLSALGVAFAYF